MIARIAIAIYPLHAPAKSSVTPRLSAALGAAVEQGGGELVATLVTEQSENTFPQLPIRTGQTVLVLLTRFDETCALDAYRGRFGGGPARLPAELGQHLAGVPGLLRLAPTGHSLLR